MWQAFHELEELRRREFRRLVLASGAAHLVLALGVALMPSFDRPVLLPGVVSVDLVAALPGAGPPEPAPAPAPAKPKPLPPVEKKVVLPKEVTRDPIAVKPKPRPKPAPERPPVEENYQDVLEKLRREAGESAPTAQTTARATAAPAGGGGGVRVSLEVAAWLRAARRHVRTAWVLAPGFRTQPIETHVLVELARDGRVLGEPRVTQRSGNPWYDESVVRAIMKASPLPAPPEAGRWPFVFRPEDSF